MGYYTRYSIEVKGDVENIKEIAKEINETSGYYFECYKRTIQADDEYKWYEWNSDMKDISKKYPELLFVIEGLGEEEGDHWRCYMVNGIEDIKSPTVTWPESDLEKEWEAGKAIHDILTED